jgi:hypothetical protein
MVNREGGLGTFEGSFYPGWCRKLVCTHSERWVFFELARFAPACMLSSVNQQHQNSPNPLVAEVRRLVEKCLAGHYDLVG